MTTDANTTFVVELGKAQVDAMFRRQDQHMIDDSEFIPPTWRFFFCSDVCGFSESDSFVSLRALMARPPYSRGRSARVL